MIKRTISGMIGVGSLAHNRRDFVAENVNPDRVQLNICYKNENLKEVYKELFDDAVERYNVGKRKDRQIANYYEKIRQGKQEKLFHEVIFQIGNREDMAVGTTEGDLAVRVLDEYMKDFQKRNPSLRVFSCYFKPVYYGVNDDGVIDYEEVRRIAIENKPKLIVAGASAYARVIDFKKFREIADEVGAYLMVDMAHIAGLVAGGQHPSPIPYADVVTTTTHKTLRGPRGGLILSSAENAKKFNFNKAVFPGIQGGPLMHVIAAKAVCFKEALQPEFKDYAKMIVENAQALCKGLQKRGIDIVSGGTDNHLMLVDLRSLGVTGKQMENLLDEVNITCNKNAIPNDPQSPFVTSGVRLGTAAVTSRGMKPEDMDKIAEAIAMTLKEEGSQEKAKAIVKELTDKYPLVG